MKLRDDQEKQKLIGVLLMDQYPRRITDRQINYILSRLSDYESDVVEEAVVRHMEDTTRTSDGTPAGRWPPALADVHSHVAAAQYARTYVKQQAEQEQRRQESDRHYRDALHSDEWCGELERGAQIRSYIIHHYELHVDRPRDPTDCDEREAMQAHRRFLDRIMQQLKTTSNHGGVRDVTNQQVDEVVRATLAQEQEVAT